MLPELEWNREKESKTKMRKWEAEVLKVVGKSRQVASVLAGQSSSVPAPFEERGRNTKSAV